MDSSLSVCLCFLFLLPVMVYGAVVPINSPEPQDGDDSPRQQASPNKDGRVPKVRVADEGLNENGTMDEKQKPTNGLLCWNTPLYEKCRCEDDESAGKCFSRGVLTVIVFGLAILAIVAIPCCCYKYHKSLCSVSTDLSKELLNEFRKTNFTKLPAPEMVKCLPKREHSRPI